MAEIVETTTIAGPTELVWRTLSDFGGISRWAPNVDHSCLTSEQGEGIDAVRRVQVGRNALLERVIEWQPAATLAYEIQGLPPVVRSAVNTWTLRPESSGGGPTTVTLTSAVDAGPRPPQQLVARVIAKAMGKASQQMVAGLKAHVESQPSKQDASEQDAS